MLRIKTWPFIWKIFGVVLCLALIFLGRIAWELFTPEVFECHHVPQPFTSQQSPDQAAFIARVIGGGILWPRRADALREGYDRRYWALVVVSKNFWGLPWWNRKIVLLTFFTRGGNGFERGKTYFVEGHKQFRSLTRVLPIFEIHCTRTAALKYADIDLRALADGPPRNGIRIMGYTIQRTSAKEWKEAPGVKVGINGPRGETTITSDQNGIYDISGLPAGPYSVHGTDPTAGPYWAHPVCTWDGRQSLKDGDVRECDITLP